MLNKILFTLSILSLSCFSQWGDPHAVFINEDTFATVADNSLFSFGDGASTDVPFSISIWVNFSEINVYETILSKNLEWTVTKTQSDHIEFVLMDLTGNDNIKIFSNPIDFDGIWTYIVCTYNGVDETGLRIYINGVTNELGPGEESFTYVAMHDLTGDVIIGANSAFSGNTFYGSMRNVKIFDVALTAAQVLTEFEDESKTTDLVAWWKLYVDIDDFGPNGLDGVNTNKSVQFDDREISNLERVSIREIRTARFWR